MAIRFRNNELINGIDFPLKFSKLLSTSIIGMKVVMFHLYHRVVSIYIQFIIYRVNETLSQTKIVVI